MPKLDSNLSRLLLDEGLLTVDQLEEAAQQQVIHGGALDTLLLELGLMQEPPLTRLLSQAWATPPVPLVQQSPSPGAAATWLPERMALKMALCPFKEEAGALHVLCAAPVDRELLEEVGMLTGRSLVPHVVPEVRLSAALSRAYDVPMDERYHSLLLHLEGGADGPSLRPLSGAGGATEATVEKGQGDWDLVEALANLAAQDNRTGISRVAVQYARQVLPFAAIFGVRSGQAVGWSRAGGAEGAQFGKVPLPIPEKSVLRQVLDSPSPLLGKPPVTDGNSAFFGWLGRRRPRTALLIPIMVARRTVAVLTADGGVRPRTYDEVSDLVAFGARLGPAFEALLRARHRENAEIFGAARAAIGSPRDGTSPFARGYKREVKKPPEPQVAPTLRMEGDGSWSLVMEPAAKAGLGARPAAAPGVAPGPTASREELKSWGDAVLDPDRAAEPAEPSFDDDDDALSYDDDGVSPSAFLGHPTSAEESTSPYGNDAPSPPALDPDVSDTLPEMYPGPAGLRHSDDLEPTVPVKVPAGQSRAQSLEAALAGSLSSTMIDKEPLATESDEAPPVAGRDLALSSEDDVVDEDSEEDEEEAIVLDAHVAAEVGLETARPTFKPLGANVGLERSSTALVLPGQAAAGDIALGSFLDGEPAGDDETFDDEISGMFPVGSVSASDRMVYEEAAGFEDPARGVRTFGANMNDPPDPAPRSDEEFDESVALLEAHEPTETGSMKGGFRSLLASLGTPLDPVPSREGEALPSQTGSHAAWTGALEDTLARRPVSDDDGDEPLLHESDDAWEDVVLDAAYAAALKEEKRKADAAPGGGARPPPTPEEASLDDDDDSPTLRELPIEALAPLPTDEQETAEEPIALTVRKDSGAPAAAPTLGMAQLFDDAPVAREHPAPVSSLGEAPIELAERKQHAEGVAGAAAGEPPPEDAAPPPAAVEPPLSLDDAVEMLDSMYKARVREAQEHLRRLGQAAIPTLAGRFPGKLLNDPFAENARIETAADLGPIIEVCESMGSLGLEAAIPHLDSPFPGHRYCATFLFVLVPDERALDLLKKRLHDHEPRIRTLATAAMSHFLAHPRFAHVLQHLRDRLASPSAEAKERAISLLGNFRDVGSIPVLIDLLDEKHPAIPLAAHQALVQITLTDEGPKAKAWRRWWERARKKTRIDWLIEALRSKERQARFVAMSELVSMTGQDFGYRCDAAKKDREAAVRAVETWWAEEMARMAGAGVA